MRLLIVLFSFCLFICWFSVADAAENNLMAQFQEINQQTVWPVKNSSDDDIISAFGPRNMSSANHYDFHSGLDIAAAEGAKVNAIADGELLYIENWEGAGNTVILRHTFSNPTYYHGKKLTYYYTLYMHLSSAKHTEDDLGKTIKAGQVIGYVGQTGNATTPHLHLQLMVGTWYDLETQLAYPNSQYSGFGFDPAVNPMLLFVPESKNFSLEQNSQIICIFPESQPLFNKVKLVIKDKTTKQIIQQHILNYNTRVGFDATTNTALDTPDITKPYIYPDSIYSTNIIIPKKYMKNYLGENYSRILSAYDIWGRKQQVKI